METSEESPVLVVRDEATAVVTLNRPGSLNAVDTRLRARLIPTLEELGRDPQVRAIVLTGAGDRAFCAGQDLDEAVAMPFERIAAWLNQQHTMYRTVRNLDKPCIAAINGVAAGAGFQLALLCDLRVGHAALRLGQPEIRAGLASIVGSYLMSLQIGLSQNQQLSLTGELITGQRAHELGLLNLLVPPDQVLARALEAARSMAELAPTAFRLSKERFRLLSQSGFDEACNAGLRYQLECYASGEPQQVMRRFLGKRAIDPRTS